MKNTKLSSKKTALIGMFGALGGVLMFFEFPLPFLAPSFYEIDLSEVPVMICTFMLGPVAGVITELVKILVKLLIKGTSTGYVGDFANFCIGCSFVLPAGIIYKLRKTKMGAFAGMLTGTVVMAVAGALLNYYVMLPFYTKFMPMEEIIAAGTKINPLIKDRFTFVIMAVGSFNLLKGFIITLLTFVTYKKISKFIKTRI